MKIILCLTFAAFPVVTVLAATAALERPRAIQQIEEQSETLRASLEHVAAQQQGDVHLPVEVLAALAQQCQAVRDAAARLPSGEEVIETASSVKDICAGIGAAEKRGRLTYAVLSKSAMARSARMDLLARQRASQHVQAMAKWEG